jgi:hypothetical protein
MVVGLRALAAVVIGCLGVATFAVGQSHPIAAAQSPAQTTIFSSKSSSRIWYSAGAYPALSLPDGGREIVRSMLNISKPINFGNFVWDEDGVPNGPVWVRIDLERQILSVFRGGNEISFAAIIYGTDLKKTPTGTFHVLQKAAHYYSHSYDAPMPYMLRLTNDGVAIHGSDVRKGWGTHGCIGVPLDFARHLFSVASEGDPVIILPAQPTSEAPKASSSGARV